MSARRAAGRIVAGAMKRFVEEVSVDMGLGGEISDEVLAEAQRRLARPPEERVLSAAKELAAGLREAAGRLDRLESLAEGEGVGPMPLHELIDTFLGTLSDIESRMFPKKQLLDSIRDPRP